MIELVDLIGDGRLASIGYMAPLRSRSDLRHRTDYRSASTQRSYLCLPTSLLSSLAVIRRTIEARRRRRVPEQYGRFRGRGRRAMHSFRCIATPYANRNTQLRASATKLELRETIALVGVHRHRTAVEIGRFRCQTQAIIPDRSARIRARLPAHSVRSAASRGRL